MTAQPQWPHNKDGLDRMDSGEDSEWERGNRNRGQWRGKGSEPDTKTKKLKIQLRGKKIHKRWRIWPISIWDCWELVVPVSGCETYIAQSISSGQNDTNTPTELWWTDALLDTHEEPKATFVSFWSLVYGLDMSQASLQVFLEVDLKVPSGEARQHKGPLSQSLRLCTIFTTL